MCNGQNWGNVGSNGQINTTSTPKPAQQEPEQTQRRAERIETSEFCQSCGTSLKPGARFCGKCGTPRS